MDVGVIMNHVGKNLTDCGHVCQGRPDYVADGRIGNHGVRDIVIVHDVVDIDVVVVGSVVDMDVVVGGVVVDMDVVVVGGVFDMDVVVVVVIAIVVVIVVVIVDVVVDVNVIVVDVVTHRSTEPRPRSLLTAGGGGTAGTGLTSPVNLLAEVVAGRSVVTDEVLSVQSRQSRVASSLYVATPNIPCQAESQFLVIAQRSPVTVLPCPGPDDLCEVASPPVAPVVPCGVLLEELHLTVPTSHGPGPVWL